MTSKDLSVEVFGESKNLASTPHCNTTQRVSLCRRKYDRTTTGTTAMPADTGREEVMTARRAKIKRSREAIIYNEDQIIVEMHTQPEQTKSLLCIRFSCLALMS